MLNSQLLKRFNKIIEVEGCQQTMHSINICLLLFLHNLKSSNLTPVVTYLSCEKVVKEVRIWYFTISNIHPQRFLTWCLQQPCRVTVGKWLAPDHMVGSGKNWHLKLDSFSSVQRSTWRFMYSWWIYPEEDILLFFVFFHSQKT